MAKLILILGTLLGLTSVMTGAAEHAVRGMIEKDVHGQQLPEGGPAADRALTDPVTDPAVAKRLDQYDTGVRYHRTHALALIGLGLLTAFSTRGQVVGIVSAACFLLGVLLFSGTLYLVSAFGMTHLTMIVPFGGVLMIAGWVTFLLAVVFFEPLVDKEDLK